MKHLLEMIAGGSQCHQCCQVTSLKSWLVMAGFTERTAVCEPRTLLFALSHSDTSRNHEACLEAVSRSLASAVAHSEAKCRRWLSPPADPQEQHRSSRSITGTLDEWRGVRCVMRHEGQMETGRLVTMTRLRMRCQWLVMPHLWRCC